MPYPITVEAAPAGESLERIRERLILITLKRIANAGEPIKEVDAIIALRERGMGGDEPTAAEWKSARKDLDLAYRSDRADLADLAYLADRADLGDRADLAYLSDLADLVSDLITLLGDRLEPIKNLDAQILDAIEVQHAFDLEMGSWHGEDLGETCGTTHCRAGSACFLHPLGKQLENVFGNWLAGAVIYQKSTGRVPDFFASNEDAMADIRACAAQNPGVTP